MWTHKDYKVGWICALPKEQTAAIAMLDQRHPNLSKPPTDTNTYTLGSIGGHNIAIACLPKGKYGTISATAVAIHLASTFPAIRFFLMVGIGGGIPPKVRLGDVVVSVPSGSDPGVIQWDMGKAAQGGVFERTGALNNPPMSLLTALSTLESEQEMNGSKIPKYLDELAQKHPRLTAQYLRSDSLQDVLFKWNYDHVSKVGKPNRSYPINMEASDSEDEEEAEDEQHDCRNCDMQQIVIRQPREMKIHHGLIASGNQVIKDGTYRRSLVKQINGNVLCIEMEAAGLMNHCPCIVIRGISDYADSHKSKAWQEHAAAVAAAFAKELLGYVVREDVDGEKPASDILSDKMDAIKEDTTKINQAIVKKEDAEIITWLSDDNYSAQQNDILKRWHPMTGRWFLGSKEYQEWLATEKQTLYCPGIPGAGKTIMASAVIHDISQRFLTDPSDPTNPTVGLAYLYFSYSKQQEQTLEHMLASLLAQLLRGKSSLPNNIRKLYDRHVHSGIRPTSVELSEALHSVVIGYKQVFIVLDALDECTEGQCRNKLLSEIMEFQAKSRLNMIATSRIHDEIASKFSDQGASTLPIVACDEDIDIMLRSRLKDHNSILFDDNLCDTIASEIIKVTEGMFLLADLHSDTLLRLRIKGEVNTALHSLAHGGNSLHHFYEDAMERIQNDRLAKRILQWVVHARRPLSISEIQHALAVQPNTDRLDLEYQPSVEILKSICAGLVTVDEESSTIRLIHKTTQEYFESTQNNWFPEAQCEIATACTTYLSFQDFGSGPCETDTEYEKRLASYHFYHYAAQNWGIHGRVALSLPDTLHFLQKQSHVESASQALLAVSKWSLDWDYSQRFPRQMNGLHLAAYFGLEAALDHMLVEYDINIQDSYNQTPLSWAARGGHTEVVQLLLEKGADIEAKDLQNGLTPLSWATENGHKDAVQLLLEKGADIETKNTEEQTPIFSAAKCGHKDVLQLLLEKGADIETRDRNNWTPLAWIAENGHTDVVQLLLTKGADIETKDTHSWTPLSLAAKSGNKDVVELLLERGANIETKNMNDQTPLFWASSHGHKDVVQLLLKIGAYIENEDFIGLTPLSRAAENGHKDVVQLLLEKGADIETKDYIGQTPLLWAAKYGHKDVVQLLLEKGADIDTKDRHNRTPLSWAARNSHKNIVLLLLENDAYIETKETEYGETLLTWAAMNGQTAIMKLLLEKGANVEARNGYGWTPLSLAAKYGNRDIVQLLLEKGAKFEARYKFS